MTRLIHVAVFLALGMSVELLPAQEDSGKFAFVVGIDKYQKRSFSDLQYAERDATELADELKGLGFDVVLLLGSAKGELQATRANIDAQLKKLLQRVGKQDLVVVSLSGHGAQFESSQPDRTIGDDA